MSSAKPAPAAVLSYEGRQVEAQAQETVLDALLRSGIEVPFSCKSGSCRTCLMQCVAGQVPASAQQGLSEHLQRMHYLLPCRCTPSGPMELRPPQADDIVTRCQLCEVQVDADGNYELQFEPIGKLKYRSGQLFHVVTDADQEPHALITSSPERDYLLTVRIQREDLPLLPWLTPDAEFGLEFEVRGPFDTTAPKELAPPATDPGLWQELGQGAMVRTVLEAFYPKVYADERLSGFFKGITIDRSIDKQYSFLKQSMTGEKMYLGERPRNAHHWMVITHELFDLRQTLMVDTLREHGLSENQIARWTRLEEYFRPDIVKTHAWPKVRNGEIVSNDGFGHETLTEASVCDHCGEEIARGVQVLYHKRLGTISCSKCAAVA